MNKMTQIKKRQIRLHGARVWMAVGLLAVFGGMGCGKKPEDVARVEGAGSLDGYFVASVPEAGAAIAKVRGQVKPGDEVVLAGRVMGRKDVFVAGRAAFILGDPGVLTPCNEKPGDECPTPWDTCCNTQEEKLAGSATIQLVGGDGRVLKQGLKGVKGLKELSKVTVVGTVDKASSAEALIVNARQLVVEP